MNIFGFEIKRKQDKALQQPSVVPPSPLDDGSTIINTAAHYGMVMDIEGVIKTENDLIRRYREISQYADCDSAVEEIVNEAIIAVEDEAPVKLSLDDLKLSDAIKKKINDEFTEVLHLLDFDGKGHDIFRNWYVDGRLYYHIMLNPDKPKDGILELRYIDPRKIRRIKNVQKTRNDKGVEVNKVMEEYFIYNDKGITQAATQGIKMSIDSVLYVPSGRVDQNSGMTLSYLHKAIKPVNQLKMMEDALVIYRITRAPERRIFYIDVGNLPKMKAEQYVTDIMNRFRNKVVYDAQTGEVRDDRKHMSMMEDFWMPRREGGKGTEITTLPGGQTLGQIEDINYFQNKLYQAMNVPMSRLKSDQSFNLGRSSEITRDEVKFAKFIARIRKKFAGLFADALRVQLITKGIIRADEWDEMSRFIRFDFVEDNYYSELKEAEIMTTRLNQLQMVEPFMNKYYSMEWIRKHVLHQSDEEMEEIDKQIEEEQDKIAMVDARSAERKAMQQPQDISAPDKSSDQQFNK